MKSLSITRLRPCVSTYNCTIFLIVPKPVDTAEIFDTQKLIGVYTKIDNESK